MDLSGSSNMSLRVGAVHEASRIKKTHDERKDRKRKKYTPMNKDDSDKEVKEDVFTMSSNERVEDVTYSLKKIKR